ncbi:Autophagy-related protein 29 [Metarhizium anisopliae]
MSQPKYTVFVRVPIPRGDFVDPPPVHWDSSKDEALWKILSGATQTEIDCDAERFDVPVDFLLKQVAYLTERHASQVRAQVRKATAAAKGSAAPSPIPGAEPTGAVDQAGRKRLPSLPIPSPTAKSPDPQTDHRHNEAISPGPAESSSNESSDEESSPAQSRIIRRPPRFQQQEAAKTYPDDGDDELEPAFQPFQASDQPGQDLASTLKGDGRASGRRNHKNPMREYLHQSQTSDDSSTGSPTAIPRPKSKESKIPGPLSPRRTAELAGRSPSGKGKASSREGSDGTPSMGSSFSDLDDASVTQSALEEALASHMNRGASSRFSISQAFRSRYTQG